MHTPGKIKRLHVHNHNRLSGQVSMAQHNFSEMLKSNSITKEAKLAIADALDQFDKIRYLLKTRDDTCLTKNP